MLKLINKLMGTTKPASIYDATPDEAAAQAAKADAKAAGKGLALPTPSQLAQAYTAGLNDRVARDALVALLKEAHAEGRSLAPIQSRYLMGQTVHLVPAVAALGLTSYAADKVDMVMLAQLYDAELKKPTPRKGETPEACEARGGRAAAFQRKHKSAETTFGNMKHEADVMDGVAGEGRRSGEGKGRPKGTTGGATGGATVTQEQTGKVNDGKAEGEGNIAPNPAPTPDAADKADAPEAPKADAPQAEPKVTPKAVSNKAAVEHLIERARQDLAYAEENKDVLPEGAREALVTYCQALGKVHAAFKGKARTTRGK